MIKRYKIYNIKYGEWDILRFALHNYRIDWFDELFSKEEDKAILGRVNRKVCYRMIKVIDKLIKKIEAQMPEEKPCQ